MDKQNKELSREMIDEIWEISYHDIPPTFYRLFEAFEAITGLKKEKLIKAMKTPEGLGILGVPAEVRNLLPEVNIYDPAPPYTIFILLCAGKEIQLQNTIRLDKWHHIFNKYKNIYKQRMEAKNATRQT